MLVDAEEGRFLSAVPSLRSVVAPESRLASIVVEAVDAAIAIPTVSYAGERGNAPVARCTTMSVLGCGKSDQPDDTSFAVEDKGGCGGVLSHFPTYES